MKMMGLKRTRVWISVVFGNKYTDKKCSTRTLFFVIIFALFVWTVFMTTNSSRMLLEITRNTTITFRGSLIHQNSLSESDDLYDWSVSDYTQVNTVNYGSLLKIFMNNKFISGLPTEKLHLGLSNAENLEPQKTVLIFVKDNSPEITVFHEFFSQQRIWFRVTEMSDEMPLLVLKGSGVPRYTLIVFDDYVSYLKMDRAQRSTLDNYCRKYSVGILALTNSAKISSIEMFIDINLTMKHHASLIQFKLNAAAYLWRIAKPDSVYQKLLPSSDWTVFLPSHETYLPLALATTAKSWFGMPRNPQKTEFDCIVAILDQGFLDGIQRVILGYDINFWLNTIVAMDAITYLTNGILSLPLTRLLQIDVDDMFIAETGIRTQAKDAEAMVASQRKIRKYIPGFTYKLGYSGRGYMAGNKAEAAGDRRILELKDEFTWFDHMHHHEKTHYRNASEILTSMLKNEQFAKEHDMSVLTEYMVVPHHAGIYPVHEDLYDVWTQKRGVACTSTEHYPDKAPNWGRRGFVYRGVMVLPRQTCRLFTQITSWSKYPGGKEALDKSIFGGYLFKIFLQTPIMIFMTHMSNYANGQLAEYSFENVIEFVTTWTNLRLLAPPPVDICRKYFEMYPDEIMPVWTNPWDNENHQEILPSELSQKKFPKLIIVGPQRSGADLLTNLLEAHPQFVCQLKGPIEMQFFSGESYMKGLKWYQDQFPEPTSENTILFETDVNYFDSEMAPKRVCALLPSAYIVVIVQNPVHLAHRQYQYLRVQNDPGAANFTFYEVISASATAVQELRDTRKKCLMPGMYAVHLARWLQYFPKKQIFTIDVDILSNDTVTIMHTLQRLLQVKAYVSYTDKLQYDPKEGHFCLRDQGCLGGDLGHRELPMDAMSLRLLNTYFKDYNVKLKNLLKYLGVPCPKWLSDVH